MSHSGTTISIPVEVTNPGQFFACCGLLELASRMGLAFEGWFEGRSFRLSGAADLQPILAQVRDLVVGTTMTQAQEARLAVLSSMKKGEREAVDGAEEEKKALESLRRELPVRLSGSVELLVDWYADDFAGGARFKTWAGQQSVLDIAHAMHRGFARALLAGEPSLWAGVRQIGLPFNFDSDLGAQGAARDVGFSFDQLDNATTAIQGMSRPGLEFLAFVGLQRFRPREAGRNRFLYAAWSSPLPLSIAAAAACCALPLRKTPVYEFRLLHRTKYLKSFLPAVLFQGDTDG